jgi:hypothetical protein
MKIPFRMPVKLPGNSLIEYTITHLWRLCDGVKITQRHEVKIDIDDTCLCMTEIQALRDAISAANEGTFESFRYANTEAGYEDECILTLRIDEELIGPTDEADLHQPLPEKLHEQTPIEWLD